MPIVPGKIRDSVFTLVCLITKNVMTSTRSEGLERRKGVNKELVEPKKMAEKDKCYHCGQTANMEPKNKVIK